MTSATVETVATRRPAMITGRASGSSTRVQQPACRSSPRPRADSTTSSGTARRPASTLRTRIVSEYSARPMITVVGESPVNGSSSENSASDGIV